MEEFVRGVEGRNGREKSAAEGEGDGLFNSAIKGVARWKGTEWGTVCLLQIEDTYIVF